MRSTILKIKKNDLKDNILLVFGEDASKVLAVLNKQGIDAKELSYSREFYVYDTLNFSLVIAGLGSASVECALSDIAIVREGYETNIILAGSAGVSRDFKIGETFILEEGFINNNGSVDYYGDNEERVYEPNSFLKEHASSLDIRKEKIISSDAFYGFGSISKGDKLLYSGAILNNKDDAVGFRRFKELYESEKSYVIDMEVAFFYALCSKFKGLRGLAIKAASNYVPFDVDSPISQKDEEKALSESIKHCVNVIDLL